MKKSLFRPKLNQQRHCKNGLKRWLAIFFSSWLIVLSVGSTFASSVAVEPSGSITAGIAAFENGQTQVAIAHWQSALSQLSHTADTPTDNTPTDNTPTNNTPTNNTSTNSRLTQAYLLSNLSAAYQQLGQTRESRTALNTSLEIINSWSQPTLAYWEISARVLNTQGQSQWQQGLAQQALTTWQQAEQHYRQAAQLSTNKPSTQPASLQSGLILSQINQALARQELGFNAQAVQQLNAVSSQILALSPSTRLSATKELGKALRRIGELSSAQSILSTALTTERSPDSNQDESPETNSANTNNIEASSSAQQQQALQLELGHTFRALSHRAIAIGQTRQAQDYATQALSYYTSARQPNPSTNPLLQTQAQLNQLSYLIETGELTTAQAFWPSIQLSSFTPSKANTEAYISYAHSLNCLRAPTACTRAEWQESAAVPTTSLPLQQQDQLLSTLTNTLTAALSQAKALENPVLEAYTIGELGHTYELSNQKNDAIRLTRQALTLLEGKQMPEIAYRWEWQLARLYRDSAEGRTIGTRDRTRTAYQQTLSSLAAVRQNLLLIDPQAQFSFRDNVEPIYREFIELLLAPNATSSQTGQQALKLAVQTLDTLQLTELENFLGCNLSQVMSLSDSESTAENDSKRDPKAAKLYPILLSQRLAIIVDMPGQPLTLRSVTVDKATVENTIQSLRNNLVLPGKTPNVLSAAQQLYSWLIEPVEPILATNPSIETLVFVPDAPLRSIPMGVLYDGEQYLIEKDYAIAIAPQLDLFAPRQSPQQLKILRGGIGLPQTVRGQRFPAIELIQAELNQIPPELTVAQPLINENFTQPNIEAQLAKETFTAIHWKTHGVFSSNPSETFLVAYQDGITANELSALVRTASQRQADPLELLVLSACATAQGDRRAVLGLAGIAVRAGTRSTLSTLWRANDRANTELMASFYQGLNSGLTKAQSLQQAQKKLLNEVGYPAPYYWASYVLVGNWL